MKNRLFLHNKSKQKKQADVRSHLLLVFFVFFAGVIIFRLALLQIRDYGFYQALASGQQELYQELIPVRGSIFMTDGKEGVPVAVATNQERALVYADTRQVQDPEKTARILGTVFAYDEEQILALQEHLQKPNDPYEPIEHSVSDERLEQIKKEELPGIFFHRESIRLYPESSISGQVLGFLGSHEDGSLSGQYGIEGYFDDVLSGTSGFLRSDHDVSGRLITVGNLLKESAVDGADLYLTIDRNIQFVVCKKLQQTVQKHGADGGSVVIVEPFTGTILAMCGTPDFDPNNYSQVENIYQFNNPVIFDAYEPGSVFKPVTLAAGLDTGAIRPDTTFVDTGKEIIDGHLIQNAQNKIYGQQTMTQVLEESINTGVIFALRQTGQEIFSRYVKQFGFGEKTGITIDTEVAGNISSLDLPSEIYSATAAFGQGITTTPLQLAMAYTSIANGGVLLTPQILKEIHYPDGSKEFFEPIFVREVIQKKTAQLLGAMLVSVVEHGHGKRAGVNRYYIAGKTGTAQVAKKDGSGYDSEVTIGTFAGFGPVPDPKFVMVVRIDNPKDVQFAESTAAPLFGEIADFLLQYFEVPPQRE